MFTSSLYADILVPAALPVNYTWSIPNSLHAYVQIGSRVEVNLGKKKRYTGIVIRLHHTNPTSYHLKPILQVLDKNPLVTPLQIQLWKWIADYYLCTEGEVMAASPPLGFVLRDSFRSKRADKLY